MKHIERKELYINLEARVEYMQSFLDFSSSAANPSVSPCMQGAT